MAGNCHCGSFSAVRSTFLQDLEAQTTDGTHQVCPCIQQLLTSVDTHTHILHIDHHNRYLYYAHHSARLETMLCETFLFSRICKRGLRTVWAIGHVILCGWGISRCIMMYPSVQVYRLKMMDSNMWLPAPESRWAKENSHESVIWRACCTGRSWPSTFACVDQQAKTTYYN